MWIVRRRTAALTLLLVLLTVSLFPGQSMNAAGSPQMEGSVSASKTDIFVGEQFTLTYTIRPTESANFKFPKIVQPIPYGFAIVSHQGDVFNNEVEIKYNELRISFTEYPYGSGRDTKRATVTLVYKGKPARHQLGQAKLEYTVNEDWSTRNPRNLNAPALSFKNRVEGPSTRMTDPQLNGTLAAPTSTVYIGDPFALEYSLTPNIEIERRDQSDYIILWDISKSMGRDAPNAPGGDRPQRLDAARYGIRAFVQQLRQLYPDDQQENYYGIPKVSNETNAKSGLRENQFVSSWTKSKPLTKRTGPQVGKAPRVTFIPFSEHIVYEHIIERTNDYSFLIEKADSLHVTGTHTDVTRVLHETMDYVLYEREHGDPNYEPAVILITDGGFDTYTRIFNEKYEARYSTDSKTAGEITKAVEATYDFDNLYLAMGIPLHLIRLDDPANQEMNYREGLKALENIVQKSGGQRYLSMYRSDRSYGGVNYTGTEAAFADLVRRTEAKRKPWGDYRNIVINQPLPAGYQLAEAPKGVSLSGGTLRIPIDNFIYNSGKLTLKNNIRLIYTGLPGTYRLTDATTSFQANGTNRTAVIAGKSILFKSKNPPKVEVTVPDNDQSDVVTGANFIIVRGKEPAFSIKASRQESYDDLIEQIEYGFAQEPGKEICFETKRINPERDGANYTLAFNSGGSSVSHRFEQYGWYQMVIKVTNTGGLSTTKEMYILVLPELDFEIEVDQPAATVSYKPVIAMLRWGDPELRIPIASKFGMPGMTTLVEYSLAGEPWKTAVFDKIHIMRQSASTQYITVRIVQTFNSGAAAPFNGITFQSDQRKNYAINYDQKKY